MGYTESGQSRANQGIPRFACNPELNYALILAYRSFGSFRQASTHLDTPPFSFSHHPFSGIARPRRSGGIVIPARASSAR